MPLRIVVGRRTGAGRIAPSLGASLVLATFVVLACSTASAQWLPDRTRSEGEGFRTDRVEIHPSFSAEVGADSNVFLQSTGRTPAAMTRLIGAVFIQPRRVDGDGAEGTGEPAEAPARNLDFNLGLTGSYYHYFTQRVRDNVGVQFDGSVRFRPEGKVGFELREGFTRTIRPFTDGNGSTSGRISYGMNRSQTTANLTFRSLSGVIRGNFGYTADATFFDSDLFRPNGSLEHRVAGRMVWSFFPRTALVYEGAFASRRYGLASSAAPTSQLVNSNQLTSTLGLNGILTQKLAVTVSVGYAAGFFARGDEYDGFVARAEMRYRPRPSMIITAGYFRGYQSSYIGNFLLQDTGYANFESAFAGRFVLGSQFSVAYGRTGLALRSDGSFLGTFQTRNDVRALLRLYGEYRATSWLAVTLSLEYLGDFTSFAFTNPGGSSGIVPDPGAQYQRVDAWVGARVYH